MQELIEVKDDISAASLKFQETPEIWEAVEKQMAAIDIELSDIRWQGEAHDKCIMVHEAIRMYSREIKLLFPDIQASINQLQSDKNRFINASENIALINSI